MDNELHPFEISPPLPPQPPHYIPEKLQISEIRSKIDENSDILVSLQKQALWLHETLKKAERRIREYESHNRLLKRHALQHGTATFQDLPPDIVNLIFQYCCSDIVFKSDERYSVVSDEVPWVLSWVCHDWRREVLSTPALWSVLPGPIELLNAYLRNGPLHRLKTILQRCGRYSQMKAHFILEDDDLPTAYNQYLPCFKDVLICLSQINDLTFVCYAKQGLKTLFNSTGQTFSTPETGLASLRSLTFDVYDRSMGDNVFIMDGADLPPFFKKMPKLRHMDIRSPELLRTNVPFWTLGFPWTQLTSISMYKISPSMIYGVLSSAATLREMMVFDVEARFRDEVTRKRFTHSWLGLLHIHSPIKVRLNDPAHLLPPIGQWLEDLLDDINLPALQTLSIQHQASLKAEKVVDFVNRSQCSLSELTLRPTIESIQSILQCCSGVSKLVIGAPFSDDDLTLLSQPFEGQWLVPQLRTLILLSSTISTPASLNDLIQARKLAVDVQSIQRIELMVSDTRALLAYHDDADSSDSSSDGGSLVLSSVNQEMIEFIDTCRRHAEGVLRTSCGYELINNGANTDRLHLLCDTLEAFEYNFAIHRNMLEWKKLLSPILKICTYLDEVEGVEGPDAFALEYKRRILKVLRLWTHDPWLFETPPSGWVRTDKKYSEISNVEGAYELLLYNASE